MSAYRLQVVRNGEVVRSWEPGSQAERDLGEEIVQRLKGKGVGVFRGEARVLSAVREAIAETFHAVKLMV